jgi:hypothetical protein
MDQVSAGDTASDAVRVRRRRMRAEARGLRFVPESEEFQTPQWLDRSFVLPLTVPEASDVPSQSVPHHDDFAEQPSGRPAPETVSETVGEPVAAPAAGPGTPFVRPPTREIDFARVIRRADQRRTASRTAMAATAVAGLLLIAYLLSSAAVVLGMAISFALVAVVAVVVRVHLAAVPIPHLDR